MEKIILVDQDKCTGCRLCEMVCSVKHEGVSNPGRSRISVRKWFMEGYHAPMICQQCTDAPCVAVCRVEALSRDEELGLVRLDYDLCVGCEECVTACPFGGMRIDTVTNEVIKCDLCDGDPQCVRFCFAGALEFVDANAVNLRKQRVAATRLAELMSKVVAA
jgi:carbon-monoxide dehydrogenase iron sulfur subunit